METRNTPTVTLWVTIAALMALLCFPSSMHDLRKRHHPTQFCSCFMQGVFPSRICLAPLNSLPARTICGRYDSHFPRWTVCASTQ